MIVLEADRVDWDVPTETAGGGLQQQVRLYEGKDCKVVMVVNFAAGSAAAVAWAEQKGEILQARGDGVRADSIQSDAVPS